MAKGVSSETSIKSKLREMVTTNINVYYILWKYAPSLLGNPSIKTFDDLHKAYSDFSPTHTEDYCETWLVEENVQMAVKWLHNRLHNQRMVELYNLYYERAKDDTQAFKAFVDFSKEFFAKNKENELMAMLKNVKIDETEDDDD